MLQRLPTRRLFAGAAFLAALALACAWLFPSSDYLYVPNTATPVADKVEVEGERPADGAGGLYYVDVTVRKATWAEKALPFLRPDGASLVPRRAVVPEGSSFAERRRAGRSEMELSEQVAAAVALEQAGYDVVATPHGARVEGIRPDAPAARALERGDVIVAAGGKVVATPGDLRKTVGTVAPGETIGLRVRRSGKALDVVVTTIASPDDPARPLIGVQVSQAAVIRLPLEVNIDLGNVGGPSAGLPFALDVLQELGRDVDRGYKIAATGEIELDGTVVPVGGLKQKTFGARRAGVDVFLVPAGDNADEARRYAGDVRVIAVTSFPQALSALKTLPRR